MTFNRRARILLAALLAVVASASMSANSLVIRARALLDSGLARATHGIEPLRASARPAPAVASLHGSDMVGGAAETAGGGGPDDCGAEGQRVCNIFDGTFLACDSDDLVNKGGTCVRIVSCGGEGQRACTVEEVIFNSKKTCNDDLIEVAGCTGNCFGPGIFDSSGICVKKTDCGGLGQRACTFAENESYTCNPDLDLIEVPGCSGDCFGAGALVSSGRCTKREDIAEPATNAFPTLGSCSLTGYADMHMHLFGHQAHGGGVLAGKPFEPEGVNKALRPDFTTVLDMVDGDGSELGGWRQPEQRAEIVTTLLTNVATNPPFFQLYTILAQ